MASYLPWNIERTWCFGFRDHIKISLRILCTWVSVFHGYRELCLPFWTASKTNTNTEPCGYDWWSNICDHLTRYSNWYCSADISIWGDWLPNSTNDCSSLLCDNDFLLMSFQPVIHKSRTINWHTAYCNVEYSPLFVIYSRFAVAVVLDSKLLLAMKLMKRP